MDNLGTRYLIQNGEPCLSMGLKNIETVNTFVHGELLPYSDLGAGGVTERDGGDLISHQTEIMVQRQYPECYCNKNNNTF